MAVVDCLKKLSILCVCVCFKGAVLINENAARVVERYLHFKEGVAYGIDQLLEPPGLGAICDNLENKTTKVSSANTITLNTATALKLTI